MFKRMIVYFVVTMAIAFVTDFTVRNAHSDSAISWCIILGVMGAFLLGTAYGESPLPTGGNNDVHISESFDSRIS